VTEIHWPTELRKIEREFEGLPPEPSAVQLRVRREAERRAEQRRHERAAAIGAWVRLILVIALGVGVAVWPYRRECGPELVAYLGSAAMIVVGGLWVAAHTWRWRMARTHAIGVALVLWGLALLATQALPRVGSVNAGAANPARWWCAEGENSGRG
jgi:hypothetical protein